MIHDDDIAEGMRGTMRFNRQLHYVTGVIHSWCCAATVTRVYRDQHRVVAVDARREEDGAILHFTRKPLGHARVFRTNHAKHGKDARDALRLDLGKWPELNEEGQGIMTPLPKPPTKRHTYVYWKPGEVEKGLSDLWSRR